MVINIYVMITITVHLNASDCFLFIASPLLKTSFHKLFKMYLTPKQKITI